MPPRHPGETALVLGRGGPGEPWRYLGVGRWDEKARELVEQVLADAGPGGWVGSGDRRCRIVGPAQGGGVRIDGGEGGFAERTVSLTDIAWVLAASERAAETGAVLDEGLVNRLRYLDGTPKGSTRWIDTGWAVVLSSVQK